MLGYRVPAPDAAMLISGGRGRGDAPFRVVTGHGAFIMPFFRKVRFLTLAMCESEVAEKCVTQQGITLNVRAVIAFKVGNDEQSIVSAAQRFLSDQNQMSVLTGCWVIRSRIVLTMDVTGWCSAKARTGPGIVSVSTNAELMNGRKMIG